MPTDEWKRRLSGKHVRLTHRIEYRLKTIIVYEILDPANKREVKEGQLALELAEDGRWMLANMDDHPVFKYWQFSGQRRVITRVKPELPN